MTEAPPRKMSLHTKILIGLLLGAVCGLIANPFLPRRQPQAETALLGVAPQAGFPANLPWAALALSSEPPSAHALELVLKYGTEPVGQIFLRLLIMTVVPLVFASLALGVAQFGDLRHLGRIGAKTLSYFVLTTALAVVIGLTLVNLVQPGNQLSPETREQLRTQYGGKAGDRKPTSLTVETFVNIVPRNPFKAAVEMDMLAIIFVALLIGIGLTAIDRDRARVVIVVLEGLSDLMVFIINIAMKFAPIGVFALIFTTTARFGFDLVAQLGIYVAAVLIGLAIHMFVMFPLVLRTLSRLNPVVFFKKVRNVIYTAFSTSSSNATLPTSIKTSIEELGVPPQVARFVLPLGATLNMNGTALFEGVTVVFLAQIFGVPMGLEKQVIIILMSVLTAIGAAGVPGGSIPLLMGVLEMVGVPGGGIGIIIGVDRLLDMCRTTLNVVGDVTCATYVARSEGYELLKTEPAPPDGTNPSASS
jgi:DAACS family dicarboxylate/amino acid:cation (Na+ or H+) symporter